MTQVPEITVVVIGDGGVGKTALTVQLTTHTFESDYNPTIEDTYQKSMDFGGKKITLTILDTAGQEEYKILRDQYWRSGDGFLIIYDITNASTFDSVPSFWKSIQEAKESDDFPVVLVGNKCDLDDFRQVDEKQGKELAAKHKWPFFESSAKERINVDEAFLALVASAMKEASQRASASVGPSTSSPTPKPEKKGLFSSFFAFGKKK